LLLILGCSFVWIMRRNRLHISVSLSLSHSFVHTNSSSTCTSSCFPSCLHNFTSSFTCHRCTCTGYFRTSISTSHCYPSCTKPSINPQRSLNNIWRINQCPCTSNKQDNHTNHPNFFF